MRPLHIAILAPLVLLLSCSAVQDIGVIQGQGVQIPPGMRALGVIVYEDVRAVPGDHVDLLGKTEKGRTLVLLKDAELAAVQQLDEHDYTVTFLISPEDAQRVEDSQTTVFKLRAPK